MSATTMAAQKRHKEYFEGVSREELRLHFAELVETQNALHQALQALRDEKDRLDELPSRPRHLSNL